jgi:type VI secretion system protein ImpJ
MKNLRRVVWSKGMFLTPQHFQVQDKFIEDSQQFRFSASLFANWGVTSLKIDQEALANGTFTLHSCRGILPDGLGFSFPDSDAAPSGRPIEEFFGPTQDSMDVYLAISEHHPQSVNFSSGNAADASGGVATRYAVETLEINDESTSNEQKIIQVGRKNFRLLLEGQNLEGFTTLRLARITRREGVYALDPDFIAPCVDLSSSDHLMMLVRRLIEILSTKSESLNANRRQRGQDLADFSVSETAHFWFLHTVNSCLPELKHIWAVRRGHPEGLYVAMLRLAGALATFSLDAKARELPDYDHDNLGRCFRLLDEKIRNLLETVIKSKCVSIPLRLIEKTIWAGTVTNEEYLRDSQFFLAVGAKMGVDDVIKRVPQLVKVSSSDEIQNLIRLSLPGITLRHAPTPPSAISFKLDNQYFSLNQTGRLWDKITQSRNISLHVPSEIFEAKIELLVVLQ